eukprot:815660_1
MFCSTCQLPKPKSDYSRNQLRKRTDRRRCIECVKQKRYHPKAIKSFSPPDWDGHWVDFEQHNTLRQHKQSLPLSIQRIIEFAQQRIGYNKIIELNYKRIEQDLKCQYKKYHSNKKRLKRLYFYYNSTYIPTENEDYDPYNLMYFGKSLSEFTERTDFEGIANYSVVHYLATEIAFGCLVVDDPVLILLQLLIKHMVVDCDDIIHYSVWDGREFSLFDLIIHKAVRCKQRDDVAANIEHFVKLIMCCTEQKEVDSQRAIVQVIGGEISDRHGVYQTLLGTGAAWMEFNYSPDSDNMKHNDTQMVEKLLFRGMLPFQFHDVSNDRILQPFSDNNDLKTYMNKWLIPIQYAPRDEPLGARQCTVPRIEMAFVAPLVVLRHFNRAKQWMEHILMDTVVSREIARIICDYLYIDYNVFYSREVQNRLNVRCLVFFDHILQFGMDKQFAHDFNAIYRDTEFIGHDEKHKFPLSSHGIYYILAMLVSNDGFNTYCESFMKLLRFVKQCYKDEFDINFDYFKDQDPEWKECDDSMMSVRFHEDTTLVTMMLKKHSSHECVQVVIRCILNEFEKEYDIHQPCLLTICLSNNNLEFFKYLTANYDYSLETICDKLTFVHCTRCLSKEEMEKGEQFVIDVKEYCIQSVCQCDEEVQFMENSIHDILRQARLHDLLT